MTQVRRLFYLNNAIVLIAIKGERLTIEYIFREIKADKLFRVSWFD